MSSPNYVDYSAPGFDPNTQCAIDTCPIELAQVQYVPSLPGNALYLALFSLFLLGQATWAVVYRTWSYNVVVICGLILEVVGYIFRLQMHNNPFQSNPFIIYLVTVTIAPAFFTAAIYLCFSRVVIYFGADIARFSTKFYTLAFISSDLLALILQAAGGAYADLANTQAQTSQGVDIMVAGLAWQVFSLMVFVVLCCDFWWRVNAAQRCRSALAPILSEPRRSMVLFLASMGLASLFIFIRSVFRCAELSQGFNSALANNEVSYMVLEGAMMVLATGLMTIFHPGLLFRETWSNSGWSFGKKKAADKTPGSEGDGVAELGEVAQQEK